MLTPPLTCRRKDVALTFSFTCSLCFSASLFISSFLFLPLACFDLFPLSVSFHILRTLPSLPPFSFFSPSLPLLLLSCVCYCFPCLFYRFYHHPPSLPFLHSVRLSPCHPPVTPLLLLSPGIRAFKVDRNPCQAHVDMALQKSQRERKENILQI